MEQFSSSYNQLPPSNNEYLKPAVNYVGGKAYAYMYETKKSKDFKKAFRESLFRDILKTGWDKSVTSTGHWYLECSFVQSNMGEDCNNYLKILLDSMSGMIYEDDRNIIPRINKVTYNKNNPRFSFTLKKTEYIGLFDNKIQKDDFVQKCLDCRYYRDGSCSLLKKIIEGREVDEYLKDKNECSKFIQRKK